jgi:hypothetical protein
MNKTAVYARYDRKKIIDCLTGLNSGEKTLSEKENENLSYFEKVFYLCGFPEESAIEELNANGFKLLKKIPGKNR